MPEEIGNIYKAEVQEVFSGDDLVLMVDLGVEGLHKRQRVRLHGIDTPNAVNAGVETVAGKVRSDVRAWTKKRSVTLRVVSRVGSSWVGVVIIDTPDGPVNLNDKLAGMGYQFKR